MLNLEFDLYIIHAMSIENRGARVSYGILDREMRKFDLQKKADFVVGQLNRMENEDKFIALHIKKAKNAGFDKRSLNLFYLGATIAYNAIKAQAEDDKKNICVEEEDLDLFYSIDAQTREKMFLEILKTQAPIFGAYLRRSLQEFQQLGYSDAMGTGFYLGAEDVFILVDLSMKRPPKHKSIISLN